MGQTQCADRESDAVPVSGGGNTPQAGVVRALKRTASRLAARHNCAPTLSFAARALMSSKSDPRCSSEAQVRRSAASEAADRRR